MSSQRTWCLATRLARERLALVFVLFGMSVLSMPFTLVRPLQLRRILEPPDPPSGEGHARAYGGGTDQNYYESVAHAEG